MVSSYFEWWTILGMSFIALGLACLAITVLFMREDIRKGSSKKEKKRKVKNDKN